MRAATRFDSDNEYVADRMGQVSEYWELFRPYGGFADKTVLELGCSSGYLLDGFLQLEPFDAIGVDIDEEWLRIGRARYGERIRLLQSTPSAIPLPDQSADIIYTIDTVEHLSQPRSVFLEAYRVLRPGGLFFIHFGPWLGPYGSHLEDIICFPWPHLFFSMDTLLDAAAILYESPEYEVACYYRDPDTGQKKANPFVDKAKWDEYLNHMTIRRFKRLLRELPFETLQLETIGFGGRLFPSARYLRRLASLPVLNEYFTKAVFCVLRRPSQPGA
ncbi:MAG: class I SAM-dependent methyltransferase [Candidatus Acidiferrales bacterium]